MDFLQVLPNLGIGVVAVLALAYITRNFLEHLDARSKRHEEAMKEREEAFRTLEREVRDKILSQLNENSNLMERIMDKLTAK